MHNSTEELSTPLNISIYPKIKIEIVVRYDYERYPLSLCYPKVIDV